MAYVLLFLVGSIWGSQYVLNVVALTAFSPLSMSILRIVIGMVTLSVLIILIKKEREASFEMSWKLFILFVAIGAVEALIPFVLIGYAQTHIDASITAIFMGMIPIFTVLLSYVIHKNIQITVKEVVGFFVGLLALVILVDPWQHIATGTLLGYSAVLGASLCFALALILMQRIPHSISILRATHTIVVIYSVPLFVYWSIKYSLESVQISNDAWLSVLGLGVFSSGIVYLLYLKLVREQGANFTALSNYIVPLVGTVLGVIFLDEAVSINIAVALVLVIVALVLIRKTS